MKDQTRRKFIVRASQFTIGSSLLPGVVSADHHKNDHNRKRADRFTIGLSQYSLRALINSKKLDALDFPAFTVDTFGIKAIDLWEGGLPQDKLEDTAYLEKIRSNAEKVGSEIFLLMAGIVDADPAEREASVRSFLPSIDRANKLGAELLRVFLRAPGQEFEPGVAASVETLKMLSDAAARKDVTIAIEPAGSPLSEKGAFLAAVVKKLNHPNCRLMPDFGKLKNNIYEGTEAMLPYTVSISAKMHSFDKAGNQPDFDYDRLMKMIVKSKYSGIIAIEWEGNKLSPIEAVKASQRLLAKSLKAALRTV